MEPELYAQIKANIKKILGINLDHYKDEQMRRRLDSWLVRSGLPGWPEYFKLVQADARELSKFRDYLTINVSAFFRDPERWQALRNQALPELSRSSAQVRPGSPGLRIWSAGCSIGPEPYTLAIMLEESFANRKHYILATDLDRGALAKSRGRGPYTADEIQNLTPGQRAAYVEAGGPPYYVRDSLLKKIEFREHDLLLDPTPTGGPGFQAAGIPVAAAAPAFQAAQRPQPIRPPAPPAPTPLAQQFDLIVCRNVVIYFTTETKDMLYRKFYDALRPGGILFVGATEIIPRPQEIGFRSFGISFYQKGA
jgi:chemotaxis protein methyltransferase CheR